MSVNNVLLNKDNEGNMEYIVSFYFKGSGLVTAKSIVPEKFQNVM